MSRTKSGTLPKLQRHKGSGQARVHIAGRDFWLGKWGSPAARMAYDRLIAEYLATRWILPPVLPPLASPAGPAGHPTLGPASAGGVGNALRARPLFRVALVASLGLHHPQIHSLEVGP